jgi:hypothetical protein
MCWADGMSNHRDSKLQQLGERIRRGEYRVDAVAVADAILCRVGRDRAMPASPAPSFGVRVDERLHRVPVAA